MAIFLIPAVVAFLITFIVTPLVIRFAYQYHLVDDPQMRKHPAHTHRGIIPRAGGIALLCGVIIPILLFSPPHKEIYALIAAACLTVVVGLWDDWKDLSPYIRLIANIATALIIVLAGIGIPFITNPFGSVIRLDALRISFDLFGSHSILLWADLFAILWIVWTMNIVGWSSGIDGQMPGFVAITAFILGILSLRFSAHDLSQTVVATLAFVTAGAFLGFLPWNFYPQKIMPGYGGKTLAGLLIATIAILSGGKVGSALLLLAIPMLDAGYALFRRIVTKKSPFRPDRNHLHHKLLDFGWSKPKIALFYWSVSFILGIITLQLNSQQKLFTFVVAGIILGSILYVFSILIGDHS